MPGFRDFTNIWNNIKEMDLQPLRLEAQRGVRIAIGSRENVDKTALADRFRHDPARPNVETMTPILMFDIEGKEEDHKRAAQADLIILLIDSTIGNISIEQQFARHWVDAGKKILVVINHRKDPVEVTNFNQNLILQQWGKWGKQHFLVGDISDMSFIMGEFSIAVMEMLPENLLSLGRYFPLFRVPIAKQLINDTCLSNAAYSVSTGLAEVVPVLDVPLNVADMFVLTKAQAFLVYKLGLVVGFSFRWQDYVTEFSSVLGSGFLWRQIARQLIGLIPAWGIVPKVAVSYAGTYVVGHVVLQWYLTGRHISRQQMQQLYIQAFGNGKTLAENLVKRLPKPKGKKQKVKALPAPHKITKCPNCGKKLAKGAQYCHACGQAIYKPGISEIEQEITGVNPQMDEGDLGGDPEVRS